MPGKRLFLPTPSARRATQPLQHRPTGRAFLPTPSARRATNGSLAAGFYLNISTHALREEGDVEHFGQQRDRQPISTHALREEGDGIPIQNDIDAIISTHALREEGDYCRRRSAVCNQISTHALREEGDPCLYAPPAKGDHFYPRPPRGGRPASNAPPAQDAGISTHALREEGDAGTPAATPGRRNFYPRPPRGGRRFFSPSSTRTS